MSKIIYIKNDLSSQINYAHRHAERIVNVIDSLVKNEFLDYKIEIEYYECFKSHWICCKLFKKDKPNQTITLFKLRFFQNEFPAHLDLNFVEKYEVDFKKININKEELEYIDDIDLEEMSFGCYDEEDLYLKLKYFSKISLNNLLKNL